MHEFQTKHILTIIILVSFIIFGIVVGVPIVSNKEKAVSSKVNQASIKAKQLMDERESLQLKLAVQKGKEREMADKEKQKQKKTTDLGLTVSTKYLESSNKNIFFLFTSLADTLALNVAELSVQDADVFIQPSTPVVTDETAQPTNTTGQAQTGVQSTSTTKNNTQTTPKDKSTDVSTNKTADTQKTTSTAPATPAKTGDAPAKPGDVAETPSGQTNTVSVDPIASGAYVAQTSKQVTVSMYGRYLDIMLYFQTLDRLSDNFELVSFNISPLVLANGYPIKDYSLTPNDYDFISGNTMNNITNLDIFYYEDKIKENMKLAKEEALAKAELAKADASVITEKQVQTVQVPTDKVSEFAKKYTITKEESTQIARYYSQQFDVPVPYILAMMDQESGFNASATNVNLNGTKDRGLMQLNEGTAREIATKILKIDYIPGMEYIPALNIEMGTWYLKSIANSRGLNFNTPNIVDQNYVLTAYNKGMSGAETYATSNKNYKTTPYESTYSNNILTKIVQTDFVIFKDDIPIVKPDYSKDISDFKTAMTSIDNEPITNNPSTTTNTNTPVKNEPLKNYVEVTSVKVIFKIIDEGPNTLLLDNIDFNFNASNTKDSPMTASNLSEKNTSNIGSDKIATVATDDKLKNKKYRDSELINTKKIISNRVANGLSIDIQLEYLKQIILHNM